MAKPITPEEMTAYVEATWNKCQKEAWREPKREWVGLTDEQIIGLWQDTKEPDGHRIERFAHAIEAKLKEKNT